MRCSLLPVVLALLLCIHAAPPAAAQDAAVPRYDLVLRGGRIVDGTGNPWFRGGVAVRGGRIVEVGTLGRHEAARTIDCSGLVVAPGFIDMHSHSDWLLLEDGAAQSKVRQGVTTEVLGEGSSVGPWTGKLAPHEVEHGGRRRALRTIGDYFELLESRGSMVNVATYVGLGNVWRCAMGDGFERPSADDIERMRALVEAAMDDGAFGLSSMLAEVPGLLATTDDIVELCRVVAARGGLYSSHIRNEGTEVFAAVDEAISIGERAGVRVDIIHMKIAEQKLWGRMGELVARVEAARRRGVDVQANVYPYTRGNNNLVSIIPPWAHEGGRERLLERLADKSQRARLERDILEGLPGWYNHYLAVGGDWSRMLVNADLSAANEAFEGQTMDRILASRLGAEPTKSAALAELFRFLIEEDGSISTIYAHHTEEDMTRILSQPWCSVGSDGLAYATEGPLRRGKPHPRSFGTFPRVLGLYARERGVLALEDAVRKMTSLNARKLGLTDRGILRAGAWADIAVFDPASVIDRATYLEPFAYPEGIPWVIVNGVVAVDRGALADERPGKALRFAPRPLSEAPAAR